MGARFLSDLPGACPPPGFSLPPPMATPYGDALRAHIAPGGVADLYAQGLATVAELEASAARVKAARYLAITEREAQAARTA